jgi:hypothetical protein
MENPSPGSAFTFPSFRFSVRALLIAVAVIGLALAALLFASPLIVAAGNTLICGLLLTSLLAAGYRTGPSRAFWLGFALFGWSYFLYTLESRSHPLVTQPLLTEAWRLVVRSEPIPPSALPPAMLPPYITSGKQLAMAPPMRAMPEYDAFIPVGHQIFTVLIALLGAGTARRLESTKHSRPSPHG